MTIESWSDNILVVELQNDPAFTDDINALVDQVTDKTEVDVVLEFGAVEYINSSNIAKLLKLRKCLINNGRRLVLCGIDTTVWGIFMVTGLEKVFEFADNVATGLTTIQLAPGGQS